MQHGHCSIMDSANFPDEELLPAGYQFEEQKTLDVHKGKEKTVAIEVKEPIRAMIKSNEKDLYEPRACPG